MFSKFSTATYSPCESLKMFFLRSIIFMLPSGCHSPISPDTQIVLSKVDQKTKKKNELCRSSQWVFNTENSEWGPIRRRKWVNLCGTTHQPWPLWWGPPVCSTLRTRSSHLYKFLHVVCLKGHYNSFQEQILGTHPHLVLEGPLYPALPSHLAERQMSLHRFLLDLHHH